MLKICIFGSKFKVKIQFLEGIIVSELPSNLVYVYRTHCYICCGGISSHKWRFLSIAWKKLHFWFKSQGQNVVFGIVRIIMNELSSNLVYVCRIPCYTCCHMISSQMWRISKCLCSKICLYSKTKRKNCFKILSNIWCSVVITLLDFVKKYILATLYIW